MLQIRLPSYHAFVRNLTALLVLLFPVTVEPALADDSLPEKVSLSWTPERAVLPDYCGPAALANVLRYWGHPADQTAIGKAVFDRRQGGTLPGDLVLATQEVGFRAVSRTGSRDALRRWLAAGYPVIVLQDLSTEQRRGHFRIVVGYSDTRGRFLVCDCTESTLCSMDYERFDDLWFHFDNWCLVVAPPGKSPDLSSSTAANPVLHFDLAEAYLRRGDREAARRHFQEVVRVDPEHRAARKSLARLDRGGVSSTKLTFLR